VADDRLERLAGVLVDYSTAVKEGDLVCIDTDPAAARLVGAVWRRVLAAGAHPHLRVDLDGAAELLLREGNDAQIDWITPQRRAEVERADVRIAIEAEVNTRTNTSVDPDRLWRSTRTSSSVPGCSTMPTPLATGQRWGRGMRSLATGSGNARRSAS
jgi:aminopeptidase